MIFSHFLLIPYKFSERFHNTFTVSCEKASTVSLTSLIMKNIVELLAPSGFSLNFLCRFCISVISCSLRSIAVSLKFFLNVHNLARNYSYSHLLGLWQFFNSVIYFYVILNGWSKKFCTSIMKFLSFISTFGRKHLVCSVLIAYLRTITRKAYLLLENLDQSSNPNTGFMPALILLIDSFSN